jgi:hypothetical protein
VGGVVVFTGFGIFEVVFYPVGWQELEVEGPVVEAEVGADVQHGVGAQKTLFRFTRLEQNARYD